MSELVNGQLNAGVRIASTEIVPFADTYEAWNVLHAAHEAVHPVEYHNSQLTAQEAEQINRHFSVEIYVGIHGIVDPKKSMMLNPTQKEYDAALGVIRDMKPGDALFVESNCYLPTKADRDAIEVGKIAAMPTEGMSPPASVARRICRSIVDLYRDNLEQQRSQGRIHAWSYAAGYARSRGIDVVCADIDKHQADKLLEGYPDQNFGDLYADGAFGRSVDHYRELSARNIVKDYALNHLPEKGRPTADTFQKPRLVLLYGELHKDALDKLFDELGIEHTVHELASSSLDADVRRAEHTTEARAAARTAFMAQMDIKPLFDTFPKDD